MRRSPHPGGLLQSFLWGSCGSPHGHKCFTPGFHLLVTWVSGPSRGLEVLRGICAQGLFYRAWPLALAELASLLFHPFLGKVPGIHNLWEEGNSNDSFSFVECSWLCNCQAFNKTVAFKGCRAYWIEPTEIGSVRESQNVIPSFGRAGGANQTSLHEYIYFIRRFTECLWTRWRKNPFKWIPDEGLSLSGGTEHFSHAFLRFPLKSQGHHLA